MPTKLFCDCGCDTELETGSERVALRIEEGSALELPPERLAEVAGGRLVFIDAGHAADYFEGLKKADKP